VACCDTPASPRNERYSICGDEGSGSAASVWIWSGGERPGVEMHILAAGVLYDHSAREPHSREPHAPRERARRLAGNKAHLLEHGARQLDPERALGVLTHEARERAVSRPGVQHRVELELLDHVHSEAAAPARLRRVPALQTTPLTHQHESSMQPGGRMAHGCMGPAYLRPCLVIELLVRVGLVHVPARGDSEIRARAAGRNNEVPLCVCYHPRGSPSTLHRAVE
jgi:hypothetical protein